MTFLFSSGQQPNADRGVGGFDPRSSDYDYESAIAGGLKQIIDPTDKLPHWSSRLPLTRKSAMSLDLPEDSGLLLKGANHPTFSKGVDADKALGYRLVFKGGRFYTVKD